MDAVLPASCDGGAELAVKLFTGSWARRDAIVVMPVEIVRAATGHEPAFAALWDANATMQA